jgi:hypothetical protein
MADPESAPAPSQARIYDYLLGGHNNLPVDRAVADALLSLSPVTKTTAVENRRFLGRAAEMLREAGLLVIARLVQAPGPREKRRYAYLLARKPSDAVKPHEIPGNRDVRAHSVVE